VSRRTSLDTLAGVAYPGAVVRAYQGGTTKKKLAAVLVLCIAGVTQAGEKDIVERLRKAEVGFVTVGVFGENHYHTVYLNATNADAGLSELCELRRLRGVVVYHPGLTEAQMRTICGLTWLLLLNLDGCPVTDAQLKQVARLRKLWWLSLTDTRVTDAGLEEVTALRDLERLWLDGTAVSDVGLRRLEGMDKLTCLDLRRCPGITDEGIAHLQKALPKCTIHR
jgi:hypothetical protein